MARHACQYIRPDVCAVGGITTSKKIAALAEAHDVLVIPHQSAWSGLYGGLFADLRFYSESGHSGTPRFLSERCRG